MKENNYCPNNTSCKCLSPLNFKKDNNGLAHDHQTQVAKLVNFPAVLVANSYSLAMAANRVAVGSADMDKL